MINNSKVLLRPFILIFRFVILLCKVIVRKFSMIKVIISQTKFQIQTHIFLWETNQLHRKSARSSVENCEILMFLFPEYISILNNASVREERLSETFLQMLLDDAIPLFVLVDFCCHHRHLTTGQASSTKNTWSRESYPQRRLVGKWPSTNCITNISWKWRIYEARKTNSFPFHPFLRCWQI